ncbi:hypothetical protein [Mucilaginibacter myungsuensis]|uniref:Uncharacterized protein n=1 Tax=Mucilaginibacter myungsuensis TaxID=649104 RepID=A0A929KX32_9SPHI|nr:hypothetical protein [Mucilaginibacter myungsuensis]MBE9663236.1 hypothetical protein [Mucilaginibacter myungsuensis]MDN3598869.1 hypothetical protein [Mucilaginibacter myungsuensis]
MSKLTEKLKKQLVEMSEVVNLFQSEAVQVKVVERLLDLLTESERAETEITDRTVRQPTQHYTTHAGHEHRPVARKPGATKVLNQLLVSTDFFDTHRSISSIADHCRNNYNSDFKTSELSGILLKLSNEHKLRRERNDINNRFEYVKA